MADSGLLALEPHIVPLGPERASENQAEPKGEDENATRPRDGTDNWSHEDEQATQHEHRSAIKRAPAKRVPAILQRHERDVVAPKSKRKAFAPISRSAP